VLPLWHTVGADCGICMAVYPWTKPRITPRPAPILSSRESHDDIPEVDLLKYPVYQGSINDGAFVRSLISTLDDLKVLSRNILLRNLHSNHKIEVTFRFYQKGERKYEKEQIK
jgi:hypothetical protein